MAFDASSKNKCGLPVVLSNMAGELTSRFAVLGGGISGLSAAYFLAKRHADPSKITLIEASSRLGGWMHSIRSNDGAIFEQGPRSLRPAGPAGWASLKLVSRLITLFIVSVFDTLIPVHILYKYTFF